jgi:hypothetical protein
MRSLGSIKTVAQKIRRQLEEKKISRKDIRALYLVYNSSVHIDLFLDEAEKIFPNLNCGIASVLLREKLGGEVRQGKYKEQQHTFLKLSDCIVDITADQYGGPSVYVGPCVSPWSL